MPASPSPGVLALQGSSEPHVERLRQLGLEPRSVRRPEHLEGLSHLVLPGGESTTIHHLLALFGLWEPLCARIADGRLVTFGTCAGAILLGHGAPGERPPRMGVLDAALERNAYGTQLDSFMADLEIPALGSEPFHAVFIRAPRFAKVGPGAHVLARHDGIPVLVQQPGILAATFHPELTDDLRIHEHFLAMQPASAVGAPA